MTSPLLEWYTSSSPQQKKKTTQNSNLWQKPVAFFTGHIAKISSSVNKASPFQHKPVCVFRLQLYDTCVIHDPQASTQSGIQRLSRISRTCGNSDYNLALDEIIMPALFFFCFSCKLNHIRVEALLNIVNDTKMDFASYKVDKGQTTWTTVKRR